MDQSLIFVFEKNNVHTPLVMDIAKIKRAGIHTAVGLHTHLSLKFLGIFKTKVPTSEQLFKKRGIFDNSKPKIQSRKSKLKYQVLANISFGGEGGFIPASHSICLSLPLVSVLGKMSTKFSKLQRIVYSMSLSLCLCLQSESIGPLWRRRI